MRAAKDATAIVASLTGQRVGQPSGMPCDTINPSPVISGVLCAPLPFLAQEDPRTGWTRAAFEPISLSFVFGNLVQASDEESNLSAVSSHQSSSSESASESTVEMLRSLRSAASRRLSLNIPALPRLVLLAAVDSATALHSEP
eukprot:9484156-Pyramimonas_sp.AAC.1